MLGCLTSNYAPEPLHAIGFFLVPNASILSAIKVSFSDFIQSMSQVLSKCIKIDKWDYQLKPSVELKNYFCFRVL